MLLPAQTHIGSSPSPWQGTRAARRWLPPASQMCPLSSLLRHELFQPRTPRWLPWEPRCPTSLCTWCAPTFSPLQRCFYFSRLDEVIPSWGCFSGLPIRYLPSLHFRCQVTCFSWFPQSIGIISERLFIAVSVGFTSMHTLCFWRARLCSSHSVGHILVLVQS